MSGKRARSLLRHALAESLVLAVAWFSFTAKVTLQEAVVGLVSLLIATYLTGLVWRLNRLHLVTHLGFLRVGWRIPLSAVAGTYAVFRSGTLRLFTGRRPPSGVRALPFDPGDDDEASRTRRVLAVTFTTLTPNSIAVGIVTDERCLLLHQLEPTPPPRLIAELGERRRGA